MNDLYCANCKHSFDRGPGEDTWLMCELSKQEIYGQKVYKKMYWDEKACNKYEERTK